MLGFLLMPLACRESSPEVTPPSFASDIRPILKTFCLECHGIEAEESNLDLRTLDAILTGGDSGPAVVAGKPEESLLFDQMKGEIMPPEGAMPSADDLALIEQWIAAGALP